MVADVEEELALEVDGEADGVESSDLEYDICKETFSLQEFSQNEVLVYIIKININRM